MKLDRNKKINDRVTNKVSNDIMMGNGQGRRLPVDPGLRLKLSIKVDDSKLSFEMILIFVV